MSFIPFQDADDIGDHFLALLSKHNIAPPAGSSFEDELLSLTQLVEVMKNPNLAQGPKQVTLLRAAAGFHDFAAKVLSVAPLPEFTNFLPHLRLIAQTKIAPASLSQNVSSPYNDDTARKMAELYIGCLAAHVGTQVDLDSPTAAKGDNPDVIFTATPTGCNLPQQPERWALAIKTIGTSQGQTIFERIKEGAEQIDDPKCLAQKGMVVINAKNALDHDALWSGTFSNLQAAMDALGNQLDQLACNANTNRPQSEWDAIFLGKVERPVLFLGQSLVSLPTAAGARTPTALKMLKTYGANGGLDPTARGLAHYLNHFMQTILLGIPGAAGESATLIIFANQARREPVAPKKRLARRVYSAPGLMAAGGRAKAEVGCV